MSMIFEDIESQFLALETMKTEDELIKSDAYVLQANYLSEIERLYKDGGLNRKELARKIKTSPSYLTQVFRGDKPLNFLTLSKIKRALGLRFDVTASLISEKKTNFQIEIQSGKKMIPFYNDTHMKIIKGDDLENDKIYDQSLKIA